jgi:UDP-N-acetylmuramoyl-L-alanyl-D-glutamate--2,6-diaminopimelate ligase
MSDIRKIVKKIIPTNIFKKVEPYGHLVEAVIQNIRFKFPARGMHFIGVTGTNGKTTTTFLIAKMLHEAGVKVGMLSTVAYGIGDDIKPQIEHMTTAQASILQKRLRDFVDAGVQWVVLETSSHSLAQNRTWGIPYEIAVMTNITTDHLDYHETFENYVEAKRRLFTVASKNGRKFGVANADDPNGEKFANTTPRSITYGINSGKLRVTNARLEADYSFYTAEVDDDEYNIRVNIPGEFNISNSLAAVAVGRELGLSREQIEKGIAALEGVEGRMTVVNEGQKFKVIVDFASTPDAFERLFESITPATKGKLVAVFGSAGRRDEAKRWTQGEIAGRYCDEIILTEEDDRDIDGNLILSQIAEGAARSGKVKDKNMFLILDREEAINFAMTRVSSPEDTVVLLGKGHEKTIERADGAHPWQEIEVARQAIKNIKK